MAGSAHPGGNRQMNRLPFQHIPAMAYETEVGHPRFQGQFRLLPFMRGRVAGGAS